MVPYNPETHTFKMLQMLFSREMSPTVITDLPQHGLIAMEGDAPIAAGFIRRIEGPYVMLDSYITNSVSSPQARDRALNLITTKLLRWAASNGVSKVLSFSSDPNTITRATEHGFNTFIDHTFQVISLEE